MRTSLVDVDCVCYRRNVKSGDSMNRSAVSVALALVVNSASATTWVVGDNDGYGVGVPDNGAHPFNGTTANFDGRSLEEVAAINGAQFTDTYSTTQLGFGPQPGTVATFIFDGLGSAWTVGTMIFDMADFQATRFGAVATSFNGIAQDWAFNDGFPNTQLRVFDLAPAVIDSINLTGRLVVTVNRNASTDFYGFDYAALSNAVVAPTEVPGEIPVVPEPATYGLLLAGACVIAARVGAARTKKGTRKVL
jgi:hypothetical protein